MTAPGPAAERPVLVRREQAACGEVAHITLNRPAARNAITVAMARMLAEAMAAAADTRVIVIRGAGGTFCAGGDFAEVAALRARGPAALRELFDAFRDACELIGRLPVPVVAVVEGYAMAGGFELVQSCDVALARDDAVLADNHLNTGMIPAGGGSQRLPRITGVPRALGHILTGDRLTGAQAAQWGVIYRSVPPAEFEAALASLIANLAGKDPGAVARAKHLVRAGLSLPLADGLALETDTIIEHLASGAAAAPAARSAGRAVPRVGE
jgi:enoyl-CoA hydratase/carnithine racemase